MGVSVAKTAKGGKRQLAKNNGRAYLDTAPFAALPFGGSTNQPQPGETRK
jgi:hypothetical protein